MRYIFLIMVVVFLCGCDTETQRKPLPDWSAGYDNGDTSVVVTADDTDIIEGNTQDLPNGFGLGVPWDVSYPVRLRLHNTADHPCIAGGDYPPDALCIMEINELDLYVLGLVYDIFAPFGMCEFIWYGSYMFENWQVGNGPTEVSWTLDASDTDNPIKDEVNSQGGVPYCPFDYSKEDGPNCCLGKYVQTVVNGQTGEVMTREGDWGGNAVDCYAGAAFIDREALFSEDGWPLSRYIYTDRQAIVKRVEYEGLSAKWHSNVLLANYYNPADHANDMPVAFKGFASNPYYEFACLDDAEEIVARIRLVVQEWNVEAEFDIDGNASTTGVEGIWNTPLDDVSDWATVTPDNTSYPNLYE
ncbi:MAG: hypothetical protein JXR76_10340 [Deltaproteobacteria bacterium]|nr:hypothetical protein [Deltaproteobacteria bacterium]